MDKNKNKILRVIDANYNRAKEGMRVVEDIFRFIEEDDPMRALARAIRHGISKYTPARLLLDAAQTRDSSKDLGRKTDILELSRSSVNDILIANLQRAKEALRVLEECFKITCPKNVAKIKQLRYQLYEAEKEIFAKIKNK